MKTNYRILLLLLVLSLARVSALAIDSFVENRLFYSINSDGISVSVKGNGVDTDPGNIIIPDSVTHNGITYAVTSISNNAFKGWTGIANVSIGNLVTNIGEFAFSGCVSLNDVTFGNSVETIGFGAFQGCSALTSITLPKSVNTIREQAFNGCTGLTKLHISDLASWCATHVFAKDSNPLFYAHHLYLNNDEIKNLVIPDAVTTIGSNTFCFGTGLESVTIHESVDSISRTAFIGCSGLTSMKVDSNNPKYDSRGNCNAIINTATNQLLFGCQTTIIPNSVVSLSDNAFYQCSTLTNIVIPDAVTTIGHSSFYGCSGLTGITLGSKLTSLGAYALRECTGLQEIICKAVTPPYCGGNFIFYEVPTETCKLYVPINSVDEYRATDHWKEFTNIIGVDFSEKVGDVTGDGRVDVADLNALINIILGKDSASDAADITGDNNVDIADLNALINIILNGTSPADPPAGPTAQKLTAIDYNIPHNTNDNDGNEGYAKLVDGYKSTKWCVVNNTGAWEPIWIDLKSDVAFKPTGYVLTTGNDTQSFYTRNPKNWKIYGRNSTTEPWTELAHVSDGSGLGTNNTADYTFELSGVTKAYQYYRFEVLEIGGADKYSPSYYIFQLAELTLMGVTAQ